MADTKLINYTRISPCNVMIPVQESDSHSSGNLMLVFQHRVPGSIPGQTMWNLQWTKWLWAGSLQNSLVTPVSHNSTNAPYSSITVHDVCDSWTSQHHIISSLFN